MLKPNTHVFQFDPDNPAHNKYIPELFRRITDFSQNKSKLADYQSFSRLAKARIIAGDENIVCWVVTHQDEVIGHLLCTAEHPIIVVQQVHVDRGFPRTVDTLLSLSNTWAMQRNLSKFVMEGRLELHPIDIWSKSYARYGFTPVSYVLERQVK